MVAKVETRVPHLMALERVMGLPVIELALNKSAETYFRIKNLHRLMYGAFATVELSLNTATKLAMPIAVPIATRFGNQIHFVDDKLCRGLDKIEEKVPLVKEKPEQIMQETYTFAIQTFAPAVTSVSYINNMILGQAENLRDITWKKTNEILDTQYGDTAVKGIISTSSLIDQLINEYFPAMVEEEKIDVKTDEEDKLLQILQTVGGLTTKAARRVYSHVVHHFCTIKEDYLMPYIKRLVEFLYITRSLQAADEKCLGSSEKEKEKEEEEEKERAKAKEKEKEEGKVKIEELRNGEKKIN